MQKTKLTKTISTGDFAVVAVAIGGGMTNVGSYLLGKLDDFLQEVGIKEDQPFVMMANHSVGGRDWQLRQDVAGTPFFEEPCFNGGWYIFCEKDVNYLEVESATSGSRITATRMSDGEWQVTLEVPVVNGIPYQGFYWETFQSAVGNFQVTEKGLYQCSGCNEHYPLSEVEITEWQEIGRDGICGACEYATEIKD